MGFKSECYIGLTLCTVADEMDEEHAEKLRDLAFEKLRELCSSRRIKVEGVKIRWWKH